MKCIVCNKETSKNNKYCSTKCHDQYWKNIYVKKTYEEKECIICGNKFTPKSKIHKCCSLKCKGKNEAKKKSKKPKTKECCFCKKQFTPYTSLDKFCSANCRVDNQKSKRTKNWNREAVEKIKGKNNPSYKHGNRMLNSKVSGIGVKEFIRNTKLLKEKLLDKYEVICCEECGKSGIKLESHHLVFRSEKPNHKDLHSIPNLIILCVKCHNNYHSHKSLRNNIVKQRGLDKLFGNDILNK